MKKIIGGFFISLPLILLFVATCIMDGFKDAVIVAGIVAGIVITICACVAIGAHFLEDK